MLYVVAFRWTEVTGGENGLGGIVRPVVAGFRLETNATYYALVAAIAFLVVYLLWRFHRSPVGHVLVAIRENEQRARFIGYPTNRYKLVAFIAVGDASPGSPACLLLFNNRMTSADPISVAFSGELLAMVVIGGMRSFLGPALGALFFVIFRDYLSSVTRELAARGSACCSSASSCSRRRGWSASASACSRRSARRSWRPRRWPAARSATSRCRSSCKPASHTRGAGPRSAAGVVKHFGGIKAVEGVTLHRARPHAARADRPQRRRQDHRVQPDLRHVPAGRRRRSGWPADEHRRPAAGARSRRAGIGRSFQITNLFPDAADRGEHPPRRAGAPSAPLRRSGRSARAIAEIETRDRGRDRAISGSPASRAPRPARCPTAASGCSTWGWRSPPSRACCCSTSRSPASPPPSASASAR